jgi:serine/threonine protein kinase
MDPSMQPVALQDLDLRRTIGTGSFGRVRLAVFNERAFALKRVKKVNAIRLEQVDRVHTEKRLLASVDHPFIIRLMGSYQDHANVYLLMEFASGGELFSHLRRAGRFPKDTARFYAAQITLALEYLHSLHVVYRGLKPEDVLLDRIGNCKVRAHPSLDRISSATFAWRECV